MLRKLVIAAVRRVAPWVGLEVCSRIEAEEARGRQLLLAAEAKGLLAERDRAVEQLGPLRQQVRERELAVGGLRAIVAIYSTALGPALGDRRSQYDLWRPNPVDDPETFRGRTFVIISGTEPRLGGAFERVEPARIVFHEVEGRPVAAWAIIVAHGYRGFRDLPGSRLHY